MFKSFFRIVLALLLLVFSLNFTVFHNIVIYYIGNIFIMLFFILQLIIYLNKGIVLSRNGKYVSEKNGYKYIMIYVIMTIFSIILIIAGLSGDPIFMWD